VNLPVYDIQGNKVGSYDIDPAELSAGVNKQLLHDAVVMYQANQRQGTMRTKSRGEVAGSTKKLYRQKGTGNARAGGRRSGTRRGGGHIFAKRPRDFGWRMPRKALQAATRMALASRLADEEVLLVDSLAVAAPQTSVVAGLLGKLGVADGTVLVSPEKLDGNLWKSARNIAGVSVAPVFDLNALAILQPRRIVMSKAALDTFRTGAVVARKAKPAKPAKTAASGVRRARRPAGRGATGAARS
jgi:large subunit ribosomal protein L4